jgi:PAS domain S-box-containing protein
MLASDDSLAASSPIVGWTALDFADRLALDEEIYQLSPVGLAIVDRDFRYLRINRYLAAINRLSVEDHLGKTVAEMVPHIWAKVEPMYRRALLGETVSNHELIAASRDLPLEERHFEVDYFPLHLGERIVAVGVRVRETTEQCRDRDALRLRTDLYAMITRASEASVRQQTPIGLYQEICRVAVDTGHFRFAWVGVPEAGVVRTVATAGEDADYLRHLTVSLDDADERSRGPTGRAALTGAPYVINDFATSPMTAPWHDRALTAGFAASAAFPFHLRGNVAAVLTLYAGEPHFFTPALNETLGAISPMVSHALDAMASSAERQRDLAELRLRERAIQAVAQGILITDARQPHGPIIFGSPGFERITGYAPAEILGRNCSFLQGPGTDPDALDALRAAMREQRGITIELLNYRKDGIPFWNELTISPVFDEAGVLTHFVGVQNDVTERRRLEQQFRQAQKMEAVGQLASGVAHDFNNLLTVINGCSELAMEDLAVEHPAHAMLVEVREAGERAGALTRQLLAFSRRQVVEPQVIELSHTVSGSEKMLRRLIGEDVILSTTFATPPWPILADPGQLEQILINLAVNAHDAMPTGGQLAIATHHLTLPTGSDLLPPGEWVVLEVRDTGHGMEPEVVSRIFEPFFTTKLRGKGTGLGLATVQTIVDQAHGYVTVESELGHGTIFRVYFPRGTSSTATVDTPHPATSKPRGSETILLAEDDDAVRALALGILRGSGYVVMEAANGRDALALAAQHAGTIDLLVSDVVMPYLGGRELAEQLVQHRPTCKVLFVSGYTDDDVIRHGVIQSEVAFLQKPYTPTLLTQRVRRLLDGAG